MNYINQIKHYQPINAQEAQDQKVILKYIQQFPHNILLRDNEFAHITSSGFIMNKELAKVLMVNHHIINNWAWTGGHADGEADLLKVAIKEAKEETGIKTVTALANKIVALDILPVGGHVKKEKYISCHVHLSVAYILIANENEQLTIKKDENSGVQWLPVEYINENNFLKNDVYLYSKLIKKAYSLTEIK
ncbi:NUDIX hydrolase [Clostridium sp. 'deep sea']|uniref:NUDIX hydrolase n=1 Tax=Clostridium sp. 'deep sea' TaxID=2779445 RepID=UPI0018964FC8|nr:NUDIX hydrolase [Clostridium sp. 'deep sea']QOR36526.1 NUDIX hydrolase [Clostridium sp. 'deep sea']